MDNAVEIVEEKVFSDGSGAVGTYKVYGQLYNGTHTGVPGSAKARPQKAPKNGYRSRKAAGMVTTACCKVERRMKEICE